MIFRTSLGLQIGFSKHHFSFARRLITGLPGRRPATDLAFLAAGRGDPGGAEDGSRGKQAVDDLPSVSDPLFSPRPVDTAII